MPVALSSLGRLVACALMPALCTLPWPKGARAGSDFVVAVPAPLTGPRAALGLSIHTVAGIIAARPGDGTPAAHLQLRLLDDDCSATGAAQVAKTIATADAAAIVGHPCAAAARVAAPIYAAASWPFLAAGATIPTRPGALRVPAWRDPGDAIGAALAELVRGHPDRRIAIVRDKTQNNRSLAQRVEAVLQRLGIPAIPEIISGGDKDHAALAGRLAQARVTHVALLTYAVEAAFVAADVAARIPTVDFIAPDQIAEPDFARLAGQASARVTVLLPASVESYEAQFPEAKALGDRLRGIGIMPTREAIETAAALQALAAAVAASPDRSPAAILDALRQPRSTLLGPIAFGSDGGVDLPYWTKHRWRDGVLVPVR